jgi:hypothetical protein
VSGCNEQHFPHYCKEILNLCQLKEVVECHHHRITKSGLKRKMEMADLGGCCSGEVGAPEVDLAVHELDVE